MRLTRFYAGRTGGYAIFGRPYFPEFPGFFRAFFPIFIALSLSVAGGIAQGETPTPNAASKAASDEQNSAPPAATSETKPAAPTTSEVAPKPLGPEVTRADARAADPKATGAKQALGTGSSLIPHDLSPYGMFLNADIVVKMVMVGLAFASFVTWTILLAKTLELLGAKGRAQHALADLAEARTLRDAAASLKKPKAPVARLVAAALAEVERSRGLPTEGVKERATALLARVEARVGRSMGRGTGILATIGSTAPFVGLFGTVWGIMNSFIGISKTNTTNLAVVAPGIAEALLATAFGLVAAIPAVIIYNMFARGITGYRSVLNDASTEVLRLLSRDLDRDEVSGHLGRMPRQAAE